MKMLSLIPIYLISILFGFSTSCVKNETKNTEPKENFNKEVVTTKSDDLINESGSVVKTRFNTPEGYKRVSSEKNSWGYHLQNLPLKPHGSKVKHYDGTIKQNVWAYLAVVDLPIGNKNLHQCADAVMRLRADYLYSQERYDEIQFLFVSGKTSKYSDWLNGKNPNSKNYWSYLENVFSYASTLSLDKQLKRKNVNDLEIGDVFIKGGSPGHTVIVVDKCVNSDGKVKFMLAQSYMPAQEIQILVNPYDNDSPWYDLDFGYNLMTSEYPFTKDQLKTF
jgi:hypothetical protein